MEAGALRLGAQHVPRLGAVTSGAVATEAASVRIGVTARAATKIEAAVQTKGRGPWRGESVCGSVAIGATGVTLAAREGAVFARQAEARLVVIETAGR